MSILLLASLALAQTLDFFYSLHSPIIPIFLVLSPIALTWLFTCVAETNRAPFDFAEGERELVSGFNTEYRAGKFALIFIAEYARILVTCLFSAALFFQPSATPFPLNILTLTAWVLVLATGFIIARTSYPRLRYDLLMQLT